MTRFYWIEMEEGVRRRTDVMENEDVNVYINIRYLPDAPERDK